MYMPEKDKRSLKKKVLDAYPDKTVIKGGHTDVNRMLKDKGLEPIYTDADETHHYGEDQQPPDAPVVPSTQVPGVRDRVVIPDAKVKFNWKALRANLTKDKDEESFLLRLDKLGFIPKPSEALQQGQAHWSAEPDQGSKVRSIHAGSIPLCTLCELNKSGKSLKSDRIRPQLQDLTQLAILKELSNGGLLVSISVPPGPVVDAIRAKSDPKLFRLTFRAKKGVEQPPTTNLSEPVVIKTESE
jgi:hypothetical protein